MMKTFNAVAAPEDAGARLDAYLAAAFGLSRSAAERLLAEGQVTVTGGEANKKYRLKGGEEIALTLPDPALAEALPEDIPLDIVFEDEDIIVINKPSGMVVHPAAGNATAMKYYDMFHNAGYDIEVYDVELPKDKAMDRALMRYVDTGRYVSLEYMDGIDQEAIRANFDKLKNMEGVTHYERLDNDVRRGEAPRRLEVGGRY